MITAFYVKIGAEIIKFLLNSSIIYKKQSVM